MMDSLDSSHIKGGFGKSAENWKVENTWLFSNLCNHRKDISIIQGWHNCCDRIWNMKNEYH